MTDRDDGPYYTLCSPHDPIAQAALLARRADYTAWRVCHSKVGPLTEDNRDWDEHAAELRASRGGTPRFIESHLVALDILDRLPSLKRLVEGMMHLDMYTLVRIAEVIFKLDPDLDGDAGAWAFLDEQLTAYLTPKRVAQVLPTPAAIARKLRQLLSLLQAEIPDEKKKEKEKKKEFDDGYLQYPDGPGTVGTAISHDQATAAIIDRALREHAAKNGLTIAEAHADIVLNQVKVSVTMNVYKARDIPGAPTFLADQTLLTEEAEEKLDEYVGRVRDMDEAADSEVEGYSPSGAQRAYLEGRDGTCRWPGCDAPAERADKDHRVNHADGGATSPRNMVCLCRRHHNRKTEKLIHYLFDDVTGDVYWLFADGKWVVDEASGPLAPASRRWLSTLGERLKKRRARLWETA